MEPTDENLAALANYLQHTLNPDPNIRRPAEKYLETAEVHQNYGILLLHLIDKDNVDLTIRIAGAIAFKNYIKRNWPIDEDGPDKIHQQDRNTIKGLIVSLMLKSPESIQKQFSDAVSIIGKHDFPEKWPNLITEMVEKFATGDFHVINGILRTAHSLFKRYRYEFKSERLWREIKLVLDSFAKPLTELFVATIELTRTHENNPDALRVIYGSLVLICKVFYSLNYQDLPEFFEDNMSVWMPNLLQLLTVKVPTIETTDEDVPGVLEQLRESICECAALYALKYDDEFGQHAPGFVTAVWNVLLTAGPQMKYDALVANALSFLSRVADKHNYKGLFEDPAVLSNICEKIVIPNMELRDCDIELFEDNPEEYVRRDMEGSDVDTRRRGACDLVRSLAEHFEDKMMYIFGQYIQAMLGKYNESGAVAWRGKDTALFLVTSLVSKGSTEKSGVTKASTLVDLGQFFSQHVIVELRRPDLNEMPLLKADAIKYVMTFRSLLSREALVTALPLLVNHLPAGGVLTTYAASCIEKLIANRLITRPELVPHAPVLISGLFSLLQPPGQPLNENEYIMKAILRVVWCLQEDSLTYLGAALPQLAQALALVCKNPSKPHFNHYLFETLSLAVTLITKANPAAVSAFEDALFPIFQEILQNDIAEFLPYVFQMLSLLLELRGPQPETEAATADGYSALLPCLVAPPLWERPANVKPLVRLLCAFLANRPQQVLKADKLSAMLGVFQKLIASKMHDHEGFYLIQSLIYKFGGSIMQPYIKQVFTLLFQRLSSSKTTKYVKGMIAFFGFYAAHYGAEELINVVDSVQGNMFGMYTERILIADLQKVSGTLERKSAAVGVIRLLASEQFLKGQYSNYWTPLLQSLISLFELPEDTSLLPDDHFIEVDDQIGYQAAYSQLAHAKGVNADLLQSITDVRKYLAETLSEVSRRSPGMLPQLVSRMEEPHRNMLTSYLNNYSVQIC